MATLFDKAQNPFYHIIKLSPLLQGDNRHKKVSADKKSPSSPTTTL